MVPVVQPQGFANRGATCWCNSLLQMLLSIQPLTRVCVENNFNEELPKAYTMLVRALISKQSVGELAARISDIIFAFKKITPSADSGQQCANEYFAIFIEHSNDTIRKLFEITTLRYYLCKCTKINKHTTIDTQYMYSVDIDPDTDFNKYIEMNRSDFTDTELCCGKQSRINSVVAINSISEVIIVYFNTFHMKKLTVYPTTLTFRSDNTPNITYELVAIIDHHGGEQNQSADMSRPIRGGHYTARCKRNEWYTLNDQSVSRGVPTPTRQAHMVAYQRINHA